MTDSDHSFMATGRMRHATFGEVAKLVEEAWDTVSVSAIAAGFQKAGLVASAPAGDYDSSDSEGDNNVPATLSSKSAELFNSVSESKAFDGF
uniref:Putative pogo transposable element n=1 Tax=Rhipicephalus microplus TaxID=6941 RepID=A0A6M2CTX9_RHIMP